MATSLGTFERFVRFVARALSPVAPRLTDTGLVGYLAELGIAFPQTSIAGLGTTVGAARTAMEAVANGEAALDQHAETGDAGAVVADALALIPTLATAYGALDGLGGAIAAEPSGRFSQFGNRLRRTILEDSLIRDLETGHPDALASLVLSGIIDRRQTPADPNDDTTATFIQRALHLDRVVQVLQSPTTFLQDTYGWGSSPPDYGALFSRIAALLELMGMDADLLGADDGTPALLTSVIDVVPAPPGIDLALKFTIADGFNVTLPIRPGVAVQLTARGALVSGATLELTPPATIRLASTSAGAAINLLAAISLTNETPGEDLALFGETGGTGLFVEGVAAGVGLDLVAGTGGLQGELAISAAVQGGRASLAGGEGDGFMSQLLPAQGFSAPFDLSVRWTASAGLQIAGGGTLEVTIPVALSIGPIAIDVLAISLGLDGGALTSSVGLSFSATLGPVQAAIEDVGVAARLSLGQPAGNLGFADLDVSFKPPTGVGIAVNSGPVHGGGFLSFKDGQYSGAVELSIYDISVKAFGLIETNVPGVDFSFVIVISAEFTPIQLGFGFTLVGVGGLVGINRSVDSTALGNLVRAGQSENLLFPKNLIQNAPTIIRDLAKVFPARPDHYVFGPLAKLGWGTPTLITGSIGIILEIPGPVIVILGEIKCLLPKPDVPLVKMNLSVGGTIDFPNKKLSLDAMLHDSIIQGYPISGQMALRVLWGEQPNFALSIGGFHPAYQPPKDFPKLQPMALDLGQQGSASITVSGFFAVTSNTVQVGGDARLHAGGSGISLDASVSVKALFVFSPFAFQANIDASVRISFHGHGPSVHLSGLLEGPSPWHIRGEVCVSIFFWDACLRFDETFGGGKPEAVPEIDPWFGVEAVGDTPEIIGLEDALADAGNWSGVAPVGTASVVSRAQGSEALVDPLGGLSVRQKAVPVETKEDITRFGVAKVPAPISFDDVVATFGAGLPLSTLGAVNDFFAPAQFFQMNDGKKLSSPGFEQMQAGYVFGENKDNLRAGTNKPKSFDYETWLIAGDGTITHVDPMPTSNTHVAALNKRSAVALGGATQVGTRRFIDRLVTQAFDIRPPTFVLSNNTSLTAITGGPAAATRSSALRSLDAYRLQNPEQRLQVQIAAVHELA